MKKILLIPLIPFIFLSVFLNQFSSKTLILIVYFLIFALFSVIMYPLTSFNSWVVGTALSGVACLLLGYLLIDDI